ncbi:hypothetical protein NMX13_08390 [Dickeya zeae]|nr:hypothetical protein NMX13_08390 [Dickeya zeae]
MEKKTFSSEEKIEDRVLKNLEKYENLSHLEYYAIFMGKAQIFEMALKFLLTRKYNIPEENMKKWTLGRVKKELGDKGLRPDFIAILDRVVNHRNYIAHEFLANYAITQSIVNFSDRKLSGKLFRATYELEQIIILYDFCEEFNCWEQTQNN